MEPELEHRLRNAGNEELLLLLQELTARHPALETEMTDILENLVRILQHVSREDEGPGEVSEDWNFSGDEVEPPPLPILLPLDREAYQQRITGYTARLQQSESSQVILEDLTELLEEAESRAVQHDYLGALDLYSFVLDERLADRSSLLSHLLDLAIDEAMPILETLLSEASSNILRDPSVTFSPLLTSEVRCRWLERLFALWLKRLDAHHVYENMPGILLNVAWREDVPLLRTLVQNELSRQPCSEHANIVDFTLQHRTRTLEKFLKELPRM